MKKAREVREQIQEDISTYLDGKVEEETFNLILDDLRQIVVDNFEHLEYKPAPEQQYK